MPRPVTVADLGTGSGAIGLALAAELPVDGVAVWLTDVVAPTPSTSPGPTSPASAAAAANVRIAGGSWFDALPGGRRRSTSSSPTRRTSPTDRPTSTPAVRDWEPHGALFAGPDGLDAIRAIVAGAPAAGSAPAAGWCSRSAPTRARPSSGCSPGRATRDVVDPSRPRRPRPRRRRPRTVNRADSLTPFVTIPARWGTQPKRTAISESRRPFLGRDLGVGADDLAGGREQRPAQDAAVMRASTSSSSSVTVVVGPRLAGLGHRRAEVLLEARTPCPASPR